MSPPYTTERESFHLISGEGHPLLTQLTPSSPGLYYQTNREQTMYDRMTSELTHLFCSLPC